MKNDLATAIISAIIGLLIAFFATNFFSGEIEPFKYTTVDSSVNTDLVDPNPEVFNYRALNPTVEVYVGSCIEYNASGECVEMLVDESDEETETDQENS